MKRPIHTVAAVLLAIGTALATLSVGSPAQAGPKGCAAGSVKAECKVKTTTAARAMIGVCGDQAGYHCLYWTDLDSAAHWYFNGDQNFTNDTFDRPNVTGDGQGTTVNDNSWSAWNNTSSNRESHYYYDINPTTSSRLAFCVNPGRAGTLPADDGVSNGQGRRDEASALIIRNRTPISCVV